jgi:hypothetical protein
VAGAADAEELKVDAAGRLNGLLIGVAEGRHLLHGNGAVRDVDVLRLDIDVVEEILPHETMVALQLLGLHGEVFVEVERDDSLETEPLFTMQADQLVVDAGRRRAGRQAEHGIAALGGPRSHQLGDFAGDGCAGGRGIGKNTGGNLLPGLGS